MESFFHSERMPILRKDSTFLLAFIWILGLLSGLITSFFAGDSFFSLMRQALLCPVSIVSLLSVILLPLLLSAFAAFISCTTLILPVAFLKAFFYALCSFSILSGFGSAGWLIRFLLIFSDSLMLPLYWMLWLHILRRGCCDPVFVLIPVLSVAFLIGSVDYSIISPLLDEIVSF